MVGLRKSRGLKRVIKRKKVLRAGVKHRAKLLRGRVMTRKRKFSRRIQRGV